VNVCERELSAAIARLIGAEGLDGSAVERFMGAASAHGINLDHVWASYGRGGGVHEVAMAVPAAGRAAMLFTSTPQSKARENELADVIRSVTCSLGNLGKVEQDSVTDGRSQRGAGGDGGSGRGDVVLMQALLKPEEESVRRALEQAGWLVVGDLDYMRRAISASDARLGDDSKDLDTGISIRRYTSGDDGVFIEALEASYVDTLDCPELCGMRPTADVLEGHRATGHFDPDLWWLVEHDHQPAGVMLLNPNPEQSAVELVYIGLAPSVRGRGLAKHLLTMGLATLAGRIEREVTCAVDVRNTPALRLYERLGFRAFARRTALVLPIAHE